MPLSSTTCVSAGGQVLSEIVDRIESPPRTVTSKLKYLRMFLIIMTSTGILMPSVCVASAGHDTKVVLT